MRKKYHTVNTLQEALELILNNQKPNINLVIQIEEVLYDIKSAISQMQDIGPNMKNCTIPNSVVFKTQCACESEDVRDLIAEASDMGGDMYYLNNCNKITQPRAGVAHIITEIKLARKAHYLNIPNCINHLKSAGRK